MIHKFFIVPGIGLAVYISPITFAADKNPPIYEKCIGSIVSAPIAELEQACETAQDIILKPYKALAANKEGGMKADDYLNLPAQKKFMLASASFHRAHWYTVRTGIKNAATCSVARTATSLFWPASKKFGYDHPFYQAAKDTLSYNQACQKKPLNSDADALWGLSVQAMKNLAGVYERQPEARRRIKEFAAAKFAPSWDKSKLSNVYKPLRNEIGARYELGKDGLSPAEFKTLKTIYHGGLKILDKHKNDRIPNHLYIWMEQ